MKGKLYTTYFSKIDKAIGKKISIVRFMPKWLNLLENDIFNMTELSPSSDLLMKYKNNDCTWQEFVDLFNQEMDERIDMQMALKHIYYLLNNGENVTLICYEKNDEECHRSILRKYFQKLGFETKEI